MLLNGNMRHVNSAQQAYCILRPMKKSHLVGLLLTVGTMAGCCSASVVKHPTSLVDTLKVNTVALVHRDGDGDITPYCSGVWVSADTILTANHCVRAAVRNQVKEDLDEHDDDVTEGQLNVLINDKEKGFEIMYMVVGDYTGLWREPKALYLSTVSQFNDEHDLALLTVVEKKQPQHTWATVAARAPEVGDTLSVMGHPSGLAWTYTNVMVSAYREENFRAVEDEGKLGPWMQVAGEVWKGNSGGGAFNRYGQLVGIGSFMPPAPNECFFVHVDTIRIFLGKK